MFEEFDPEHVAVPPSGSLTAAMNRGRRLRRQRRAGVATGLALSAVLIGGFAIANPLRSDKAAVVPADPKPDAADYAVIPKGLSSGPGQPDFGNLVGASEENGVITLKVNREQFYTGEVATARNHGEPPMDDYLTGDDDGERVLTFTLDPKATILAGYLLMLPMPDDPTTTKRITAAQLVKAINTPMPDSDPSERSALIWMRHFGGPDGPVTSISEQFTP